MPHPSPPKTPPRSSRRSWTAAVGSLLLVATLSIESCATRTGPLARSAVRDRESGMTATSAPAAGPAAHPPASATAASGFEASVRPVLSGRCAPCHEPGGRMHARLPFDDPAVVAANAEAIARRLKGDDVAALRKWAAALPRAPAAHP